MSVLEGGQGYGPVKTSWEGGFFQTSVFAGADKVNEAMAKCHDSLEFDVTDRFDFTESERAAVERLERAFIPPAALLQLKLNIGVFRKAKSFDFTGLRSRKGY